MNKYNNKYKFIITQIIVVSLIFVTCFSISLLVIRQLKQEELIKLREEVSDISIQMQSDLIYNINSSLNLVLGLVGYININSDPDYEEYEKLAKFILRESGIIRNIAIAPDNVISYVYPSKGNEAALGLDYMKTEAQRDSVLEAIESKKTNIAGPVNLVQGGEGFIARIPIFIGVDSEDYWGIASIVVDKNKVLNNVLKNLSVDWLEVAIIGKDGKGLDGEIITGNINILEKSPILTKISLPGGYWVLAAVPIQGWHIGMDLKDYAILAVGLFIFILTTILILTILSSSKKMSILALQDPLTKLSNRRMFEILADRQLVYSKRTNTNLYIIYLDLDNFKQVNDQYGHKTGDIVLESVANKITESIRQNDIFARIGGDEFIILPCDLTERADLIRICNNIILEVNNLKYDLKLKIELGCSIGVSCFPEDGNNMDDLIKKADNAMYISKNKGKNQYTFNSNTN